jgi:hypothetical protein
MSHRVAQIQWGVMTRPVFADGGQSPDLERRSENIVVADTEKGARLMMRLKRLC